MSELTSPEKTAWGWKALIIFGILGALFLGIFWLAMSNEPDYMPSQQGKHDTQQHAFKTSPVMSQEALATAQQQNMTSTTPTAQEHGMSAEEHAAMDTPQPQHHGH